MPEPVSIAIGLLTFALEKLRNKSVDIIAEPVLEKLKSDDAPGELWSVLERAYLRTIDELNLPEPEYRNLLEHLLDGLRSQGDGLTLLFQAGDPQYGRGAIEAWRDSLDANTRTQVDQAPTLLGTFAANFKSQLHSAAEKKGSSLGSFVTLLYLAQSETDTGILLKKADPGTFDHRFERFRQWHLSKRFAGRTGTLNALNKWLGEKNGPCYLLLAAEAGRGKSALLVHWTETFHRPHIFIPVSIWGRTNSARVALGSLARALAIQHRLSPAQVAFGSAEELEREVRSLLSRDLPAGETALVVLDGLDEASGWAPDFPAQPGAGFKVVISARLYGELSTSEQWRKYLRLSTVRELPLPPLDEEDVRELVPPEFASDEKLVHQLFVNTQGDPLLLRLYQEELSKGGQWTASSIRRIQPGYTGFFHQWWKDQRELRGGGVTRGLQAVLSVLALAEGPLFFEEIADLLAIAANMGKAEIEHELDNLDRLLIGGRETKQPYAFVHDRLRFYFRDELVGKELARKEWNQRFIDWGANVLQRLNHGDLQPPDVPEYLILNYSEHLSRLPDTPPERYFELLSAGWREASHRVDRGESTIFSDATRAFEIAQKLGTDALAQQIRALLCRISISAEGDGLPPDQLRLRVERKEASSVWALDVARRKPSAAERSTFLAALAPLVPEQKSELLSEAIANARAIRDYWERRTALVALVPALFPEQLTLIWDAAMGLSEPPRLDVLLAIAEREQFRSYREKVLKAAFECIAKIFVPSFAADAAIKACKLAPGELRYEAAEVARKLAPELTGIGACALYVQILPFASVAQRTVILKEAKRRGRKLSGPLRILFELDVWPYLTSTFRDRAVVTLRQLAGLHWESLDAQLRTRLASIPNLLESISRDLNSESAALTVVRWPSHIRPYEQAVSSAPRIHMERRAYCRTLAAYAGRASISMQEKAAASLLEVILRFPDLKSKIATLAGPLLRSRMNPGTQWKLIEELWTYPEALAEMLGSPTLSSRKKVEGIQSLLALLNTTTITDRALASLASAIGSIPSNSKRSAWLKTLESPHLPAGLHRLRNFVAKTDPEWTVRSVLPAIRSIANLESRTEQVLDVADYLPDTKRTGEIQDAVQWVRRIRDPRKRALLFCRLSDFLPDDQSKAILLKALHAFAKIEDSTKRKRVARQFALRSQEDRVECYLQEGLPGVLDGSSRAGNTYWTDRARYTGAQYFLRDFLDYARITKKNEYPSPVVHAVWAVARTPSENGEIIGRGEWLTRLADLSNCLPACQRSRLRHEIGAACKRRKGELAGQAIVEMGSEFPAMAVLNFCPELLSNEALTEMLTEGRRRTRREFYQLVAGLEPIVFKVGSHPAVDQVVEALVDTANWWAIDRS